VDLPGRGVRAQQHARRGGVEGVLHIARGVMRRDVEQLEVHLVALHLGRAVDLEAEVAQNAHHFAQRLGDDVQPPACKGPAGHGHIQPLRLQRLAQRDLTQRGLALLRGCFQRALGGVGALPHLGARFLGQLAHQREDLHHRRAAAQMGHAPGLQILLILDRFQRQHPRGLDRFQLSQNISFVGHTASCKKDQRLKQKSHPRQGTGQEVTVVPPLLAAASGPLAPTAPVGAIGLPCNAGKAAWTNGPRGRSPRRLGRELRLGFPGRASQSAHPLPWRLPPAYFPPSQPLA